MANRTKIEWTDRTWNPLKVRVRKDAPAIAREAGYASLMQVAEKIVQRMAAGKHSGVGHHCEHVSPACENCYAEANNRRCLPANGTGLPYDRRSRDLIEAFVDNKELLKPLSWRQPGRVFVENQSDLFGEWYTDEMRDYVFAVMLANAMESFTWKGHPVKATFQVLTKRSRGLLRYFADRSPSDLVRAWAKAGDSIMKMDNEDELFSEAVYSHTCHDWDEEGKNSSKSEHAPWKYLKGLFPLHGLHVGVTVEDEPRAEERIPDVLRIPAELRYLSVEPMLGPLRIGRYMHGLGWVICGTESGLGARPTDLTWIRDLRYQCFKSKVPFFLKQLTDARGRKIPFEEWPADLRVRQLPEGLGGGFEKLTEIGESPHCGSA